VDTVAKVVAEHGTPDRGTTLTLEDVLAAESWARARARAIAAG
jgi:1-deoxy-D-xylulose-5-phosphate reductoisomerase